MKTILKKILTTFCLIALAGLGSGCAHKLTKSAGGIGGEVPLEPKKAGDTGSLVYRAPGYENLKVKGFSVPPVRIHRGADAKFADITETEKRMLAERLQQSFERELAKGYTLARAPGPGVLRLQLTLVDVTTSVPVVSTLLRTISPISLAVSAGQSAVGAPAALTGAVRVAGELFNAQGELVGAFVVSESPLALDLRSGLTKFYATEIAIDAVAAKFKKAVDKAMEGR